MAEFEASRGMPAESMVVFGVASDVEIMDRWLPRGLSVHGSGPGLVEADGALVPGSGRHEGLLRVSEEQLRVEWGGRDHPDYSGWLQVADGAVGESEVTVHLSLLDEPEAGARADEVRELLDSALDGLADEVRQRVSDAS